MKRTHLRWGAQPRPLAAAAATVALVVGAFSLVAVSDGGSPPTKVAVGKVSTTTTIEDVVDGGAPGVDGRSTSWPTTSTMAGRTPIPATTPIPVVAPATTTSTTAKPGTKPTTTTSSTTIPPDNEPEPIRYPTGPPDPIEFGHVYVAALDDAAPHKIASDPDLFGRPVWSADGRRVLYAVENEPRDVFTVKADGSGKVQLPAGGIETPVWSAQGDIAVIEYDGVGHNLRIHKVLGAVHVISHQQVGPVSGRQWSPDGTRLALIGGGRLWVANADGGEVTPLTPEGGKAWKWLQWSPDGTRIAFHEGERLKVVGADGSGLVDVAPVNADPSFSWSPDGTELVLCLPFNASPQFAMGIVPAGGGEVRPLGVQGTEVAWSPDGRHILYKAFPAADNRQDIRLVSPDGTNSRSFILPPAGIAFGLGLSWSPDGSHVLLNTGQDGHGGVDQPF